MESNVIKSDQKSYLSTSNDMRLQYYFGKNESHPDE